MIPEQDQTVRFAPRDNPRRKKTRTTHDPAMLRRSARNGAAKAYSNVQAPITVAPYQSMNARVQHSVPYLDGQDDIPRSDEEDGPPALPNRLQAQSVSDIGSQSIEGVNPASFEPFPGPSQQSLANNLPDPLIPISIHTAPTHRSPTPEPNLPNSVDSFALSHPTSHPVSDQILPAIQDGPDNSTILSQPVQHTFQSSPVQVVPPAWTNPGTSAGIIVASTSSESNHILNRQVNIEQRQNLRHQSRIHLAEALLHGPTRRHTHEYMVEWYTRNKAQMYAPNPKASSGPSANADNSRKYQGSFSLAEQRLMFAAGHSMVYELICIDPFPAGYALVERGIAFAESVISARIGAQGPSDALQRFMKDKLPRKRNELVKLASGSIISKYDLPTAAEFDDLDAYHRASDLIQDDSFVNAGSQPGGVYEFTHPAILSVLKILFLKSNPKLGMIFIDRLAASDSPNTPWHKTRRDHSLEAVRGMPIEAIAFACTLIKHVLFNYKQVTMGDPVSKFEGKEYSSHWARFYRKLTNLPNLGELRKKMLDAIKTHYVQAHPYDPNESMVEEDVLW
ncbi:hypothetical protein RSOLAG22IIIB_12080 [Rhizoctonia solani]|uniref:DUF6532 domain-containing protein n=1 Tax=Rhizoctonia solani TaxID=456999 RepID=A0A0K6GC13_9AGAM|nr:hypothetical protein RSOLAG22IIIB_12080 [Rhizoctonia solani]